MSETTEIKVQGMTCKHCVAAVEKALAATPGVEEVVEVSLESGLARVRGDAAPETLIAAVLEAGYQACA